MKMFFVFFLFVSCVYACETHGAADFSKMMQELINGEKDKAYSILKSNHCGDSIAWRLATDLVNKSKNPKQTFKWIAYEQCDFRWKYSLIPIIYIEYGIKEKEIGIRLLESFYKILDNSNCNKANREFIMIYLDALYGCFSEM